MNKRYHTLAAVLIGLRLLLPTPTRGDGLPRGDAQAKRCVSETVMRIGLMLDDAVARCQIVGCIVLVANPRQSTSKEEYARLALTHPGDAGRGQSLVTDPKRLACARCHQVRGEGGEIGPDLSDVGGKFGRPQLIESILDPSRQILEGYGTTTLHELPTRREFSWSVANYSVDTIMGSSSNTRWQKLVQGRQQV